MKTMQIYFGTAFFVVGMVLFVLSLRVSDEPGNWFANLMRSEFSALAITIFLGFGIALCVDSALESGAALVASVAIGGFGVIAVAVRQITNTRRKLRMPHA